MFERTLAQLAALRTAGERIVDAAAPRIEAKLREDSTTKRGNAPSFGKFGDAQTVAMPVGETVEVVAADWVHKRARDLGQPDEWNAILAEEVRAETLRIMGGGR